ncbi:MAG: 50S ribosomal protein L11 methyltransferase [Rhodobacteraceae bacterium]|jgi:ribosomal protein L11 methyltransferase|uniref:Ribosomal protein L11 methyltransferase n=1 Tax=Salipiger profundus TaxID=1229727 RepID=A0A1U7D235_9RHOB|nr:MULTISPECIES: 50S ribosomal protein L11 methyltransferase [Salipiger]APX22168.1 (LSU ribosomal protein L11P)-lysine N-methyltransferase [Salipiger profundus]MAB05182.1 50S ribosomal protein L11 methyltransferase [Paracoccaceae bacterium]GGA07968.1 ribosomal protein L11 methyltransferase [Salipiger profundus]SFC47263.1 [LSU ribosomal protein L11P]-lysine N-methyltransferase [Salipiger profundus]
MPRTWTAFTKLDDKDRAEALGEALEDLDPAPTGVGVFEIEDGTGTWEVGGYFVEAPDDIELALVAAAYDAPEFVVSEVPDQDWVDKVRRELTPVEAGRFFVYGSHDADKIPEGAEPLLIEAAMAFGTGHHGTTLGCLRALDRLATDGFVGRNVADIGCGTAVLAMGAARIWNDAIIASDIDEVAVEVAEANLRANDLTGKVTCVESAGFDNPEVSGRAPFDLVFANILKQPLIDLAPDMARYLGEGGYAILSGILTRQADEVVEVYARNGINLAHREEIGDWVTLTLRKSAQ